jgi:hypothetical protein
MIFGLDLSGRTGGIRTQGRRGWLTDKEINIKWRAEENLEESSASIESWKVANSTSLEYSKRLVFLYELIGLKSRGKRRKRRYDDGNDGNDLMTQILDLQQ